MGKVRDRDFDAVIGVGGIGTEAEDCGIAGRINWIGIGPHKLKVRGVKWPMLTFDHFCDFGTNGRDFRILAPNLAERMYSNNFRQVMDDVSPVEYCEMESILRLAEAAPPSLGRPEGRSPIR